MRTVRKEATKEARRTRNDTYQAIRYELFMDVYLLKKHTQ
jgi:hypothetical protein